MDFQIIALDIDGTLTDDRKKISSLTLETLIEAEKKGIRLVLASARPAPGLFSIRDQLKMEQFGGILMSYNGGRITDCEGNTFYEISMDLATTRRILRFLEKLPVTVIVDDGKMFYVTDKNGYKVEYECRNNQMQCTEGDNLADWLTFSPIKLLLAVDPMKIYEVQEQIRNFLPEDLTVVRTAAFYLEIFSRRINKGQGLCDICRILKIDVRNSIAFGDSENDIPMLKAAGIGIAMKNAEMDVKKASSIITQKVDRIAKGLDEDNTERIANGTSPKGKTFYASVAYLQTTDDRSQLDELREKGDYEGLLACAKEYYDGNGMDEQYTYQTPLQHRGDDLLVEDKDFAVVYNGSVGGTYEVMLKYSEQEVRDHINRYGIDRASVDVKELAKDMVVEQFAKLTHQRMPVFEMPNGDILYAAYNREKDALDVGGVCNAGLAVRHSFPYDYNSTLDANLQAVNEKLNELDEYREELQEAEYGGGMRR